MSFEQDKNINENDIIGEIIKQPDLYYKYSSLVKELSRDVDYLTERLDVQKIKSINKIRKNYEQYGFSKEPSDTAIYNGKLWNDDDDFLQARKKVRDAEYDLGMAITAEQSIVIKKTSLELLVKAKIAGIYAEPQNTDKQNVKKEAKENTNVVNEALIQEKKDEI